MMVDEVKPISIVVMILGCVLLEFLVYSFPQYVCEDMIAAFAILGLMGMQCSDVDVGFVDYLTVLIPFTVMLILMFKFCMHPVLACVVFCVIFFGIAYVRIKLYDRREQCGR